MKQGSVPLRSTLQPMRDESQDAKPEDLVPPSHKIHHQSVLAKKERPRHGAIGFPRGDSQALYRLQVGADSALAKHGLVMQDWVLDPTIQRGVAG